MKLHDMNMNFFFFSMGGKFTMFMAIRYLLEASSTRRLIYEHAYLTAAPRDWLLIVFVLVSILPMALANPLLFHTTPWAPLAAVAVEAAGALSVLLVDRARAIRARREPSLHIVFSAVLLAFLALYQLCFPQILVYPMLFTARKWTKTDETLWVLLMIDEMCFGMFMLFAYFNAHQTEAATRAVMQDEARRRQTPFRDQDASPADPVIHAPAISSFSRHSHGTVVVSINTFYIFHDNK